MATRAPSSSKVLDKLRAVVLALPDTIETETWGHPNFRVGKKIFAAFHADRSGVPCIWLRVDPLTVTLLTDDPRILPSSHGGVRWVGVRADGPVDWTFVRELAREGYDDLLPKARNPRSVPKPPKKAVVSPSRRRPASLREKPP